jgi:drug/metabolite transporter (DMT)-like permease
MLTVSLSAIFLSLGCGLAYSASDYFRKSATADCSTNMVLFYFIAGQLPILITWAWLSGDTRVASSYWLPGIADVVIGLLANAMFIFAVKRSPLSLMIPLLALVPVVTAITSALALQELLSPSQMVGTVLIVLGLMVLYNPPGYGLNLFATWRAFRKEPGVGPMMITVVGWSVTAVLDKLCLQATSLPMHAMIQVGSICALTGVWIVMTTGVAGLIPPKRARWTLVGAALAATAGYTLQLASYQATLLAIAEGLKRVTSILSSLVVGRLMFNEPLNASKVVGIGILIIGVPLILMG